ncbi:type IV pilin protein [Enterovibrio makurazakiensis]|uniref:type IV pilin protein n=1 Tax=Enterovibrio makurazakiensis TaxID=2910232 RepID=UPI003D226BB4
MAKQFMTLRTRTFQTGMTLIEILVAVAIIGAIAAISIPAFGQYVIKSERSRVQTDLYQLQVWVEQQYTIGGAYPAAINCTSCQLSDEYTFSIEVGGTGNNAYKLKATPKATSKQKNDTDCYIMVINAGSEQSNQNKDGVALNNKCWI